MFFFLSTDDAYLLSSWSGSFSPMSRRQKRPCYGYVYMVIVTHKHDYVYVKGIFGKRSWLGLIAGRYAAVALVAAAMTCVFM